MPVSWSDSEMRYKVWCSVVSTFKDMHFCTIYIHVCHNIRLTRNYEHNIRLTRNYEHNIRLTRNYEHNIRLTRNYEVTYEDVIYHGMRCVSSVVGYSRYSMESAKIHF